MPTSVTMPTIMVMPIMAVMFSSVPVSHSPMKTAASASRVVASMATATRKLS